MDKMRTLALPSLMIPDVSSVLGGLEQDPVDFDECIHIAATSSIAQTLRKSGRQTLQISHLITMLVEGIGDGTRQYPGLDRFVEIDDSDRPDMQLEQYERQVSGWEKFASGKYLGGSIETMTALSRHVRSDSNIPETVRRALRKGWIDFAKAIRTLVESGFAPSDLRPSEAVGKAAQRVWQMVEDENGRLGKVRETLWIDPVEYVQGTSDLAQDVAGSLRMCLEHVFGPVDGRVVLQHGFHFFTPPQWAIFRTIEASDWLRQIFLVHDDGSSDVFETWRHYFGEGFGFAPVEYLAGADGSEMSDAARSLVDALAGRPVVLPPDPPLRLLKMRNTVAFVQHSFPVGNRGGRSDDAEGNGGAPGRPAIFAPNSDTLDRLVSRFVDTSQFGAVELSSLPLGIFLVRLHECIKDGPVGTRQVHLTRDSVRDIVASGLLPHSAGSYDPLEAGAILGRVLEFFEGCTLGDQWVRRARNLRDILVTRIHPFFPRDEDCSLRDHLLDSAEDFWRLIPWADLTRDEVELVLGLIETINDLIEKLIENDKISLEEFTQNLQALASAGLAMIADEHREDFEARIAGLRATDTDTYVTDLADIVKMLVAAPVEIESDDRSKRVRGFGAIDRFAYVPVDGDLHISNLSDLSFPRGASPLGWPFRVSDLVSDTATKEIVVRLLDLRADTAPQSDLYVLWVGLNAVRRGGTATLSYIAQLDREELRPSPVMALLADVTGGITDPEQARAVARKAGGFEIDEVADRGRDARLALPRPRPVASTADEIAAAVNELPSQVVAASLLCERRLALQWVVGLSPSFSKPHMQSILYGNLPAALRSRHGLSVAESSAICDELFRHLTQGQRLSSLENRRIIWDGEKKGPMSASWQWLFTIGMRAVSDEPTYSKFRSLVEDIERKGRDPLPDETAKVAAERSSRAYRAARGSLAESTEAKSRASRATAGFLPRPAPGPLGVTDKQCNNCPVSDRCLSARH